MRDWKTANRYANALLSAAEQSGQLEKVYEDLQSIRDVVRKTPELVQFLRNPVISNEQKKATFKALFSSTATTLTMDFLYLLCAKSREMLLEEIIESFVSKRDEKLGRIKAEVVSVVDLNQDQISKLTGKIKTMTGKTPELTFSKDPALIGGFTVRIGDHIIDGSVRHQLHKLRERLAEQA